MGGGGEAVSEILQIHCEVQKMYRNSLKSLGRPVIADFVSSNEEALKFGKHIGAVCPQSPVVFVCLAFEL